MLKNTHKILANNILDKLSPDKSFLINKKRFVWGNIKPDYVSKYKLKKHFYDESIDMIIDKIYVLSELTVEEIYLDYGRKKFSAELGVVCHFLCDFFCLAHNKRWRLKTDFKKHVSYEQELARIAKDFDFGNFNVEDLEIIEIKQFIEANVTEYEKSEEFSTDLLYSLFICSTIISSLLNKVVNNECHRRRAS